MEVIGTRDLLNQSHSHRHALWKELSSFSLVLWCGAETNPDAPDSVLEEVNFRLPVEAISASQTLGHFPKSFATFGSAFEGLSHSNKYLESKFKLASWISAHKPRNVRHLRTHTLIGRSIPNSHMFLYQLLSAIHRKVDFNIGSPKSVRQYISYDAFTEFLLRSMSQLPSGVIQIGGAKATSLEELSAHLLLKLGSETKLKVNPERSWEGSARLKPHADDLKGPFEDSIDAVMVWFPSWIQDLSTGNVE